MRFEPLLFVFVLGCGEGLPFLGGDDDASVDVVAEAADAAPFETGPHGPLPQQVNLTPEGGVVTAMNVVPIFFANDPLQNGVVSLLSQLPASVYWSELETEYGVGPLTIAPPIVLSDTPPSSANQTDVPKFIASKLATDPSWPAPTDSTLYFIYYPAGTTLTYDTATSCTDFLGYHYYGQIGNTHYLFAVQARCSNGQIPPIDDATQNTTHELVEAATDPFLLSYATTDPAHVVWTIFPGFEIGDMCELEALSYQRMVGVSLVARYWANTPAAAGHDPCAPSIKTPYFNAVPVLPDQVSITLFSGTVLTDGVAIPVGTTRTIDVQLFSDAPFAPWTLEADDGANFGGVPAGELAFIWDHTTGGNGDVRKLQIKRLKDGPFGGTEFVIHSYAGATVWHEYFAFAGN